MKREDTDFTAALKDDVRGMRIGIPRDYLGDGLEDDVKTAVLAAADALKQQGAMWSNLTYAWWNMPFLLIM